MGSFPESEINPKFLVKDKITASCQTKMSPKHYILCCKQQKWTLLKNCSLCKVFKNYICSAFLHVCPSVTVPYCIFCIIMHSFNALMGYFSILWHFRQFKFWSSWHSSFKKPLPYFPNTTTYLPSYEVKGKSVLLSKDFHMVRAYPGSSA